MSDRWTPRRLALAASLAWAGTFVAWYIGWEGWGHGGILYRAWERFSAWREGRPSPGLDDWPWAVLIGLLPLMTALFLSSAALAGGSKHRNSEGQPHP